MNEGNADFRFSPDKVERNILDMEDKKQSLIQAVQKDIAAIDADIQSKFLGIGKKAYELSSDGTNDFILLEELFAHVRQCENERMEKSKKIDEITQRYDEEIMLLKKLLPNDAVALFANTQSALCLSCNAPYKPGIDMFCTGCGAKLSPSEEQHNCPKCGKQYNPGVDMFCTECGYKL